MTVFTYSRASKTLNSKLRGSMYDSQTDASTGLVIPRPKAFRSARLEAIAAKYAEEQKKKAKTRKKSIVD